MKRWVLRLCVEFPRGHWGGRRLVVLEVEAPVDVLGPSKCARMRMCVRILTYFTHTPIPLLPTPLPEQYGEHFELCSLRYVIFI